MANELALVEHQHLSEMHENLQRRLREASRAEAGERIDSVRRTVLSSVVSESYDRAKEELHAYVDHRHAYPLFQDRAERYVNHCADLIQAIQVKRHFPGLANLSLAKQQEIHEKVLQHFEELKQNLKQIEKVEREHKVHDLRTTVWVVKTACVVVAGLLIAGFYVDFRVGLFSSTFEVLNGLLDEASTWVVNLFP